MIVTSSRLHAVRYKQNIDKYINAQGYTDIKTLVAFSGKIDDGTERPLSETNMNGLPESRTAKEFGTPEYGVLIAADKFQTGFDEPLLHTMYVDKPLVGLAAVQTLSRLDRIHPLKQSTFVLDFRNDTEDVVAAFEQFHGCTVPPPTDPNILWDTRRRLDNFDVLRAEEVEAASPALLGAGASEEQRSAETYAALGPAKARFEALEDERRLEFRDAVTRFVRTYSFVSQIAAFTDPALGSQRPLRLTDVDKLFFDQIEEACVADDVLSTQARNNTIENFSLVFEKKFLQTVIARADANDEILKRILDDEEFAAALGTFYLRKVYERLREGL